MATPSSRRKDSHLDAFLDGQAGGMVAFVQSKFREKAINSQRQWFDLLLAALPEKVLDQVMDVVDNIQRTSPMTP
jgi:hypothetical protein